MPLTFETKRILFDGNPYTIVLQNENGPCALLALVNVILLSNEYIGLKEPLTELVKRKSKIDLEDLLQILANIGLATSKNEKNDKDIDKLLQLLPSLHTGLNINPKFDGTFEDNQEMLLFRLYNADVIHGWVMDPEGAQGNEKLSHFSYEQAQEILTSSFDMGDGKQNPGKDTQTPDDVSLLTTFIDGSPTQLTEYGIKTIQNILKDNSFAVLFRNNHFATILKYKGILYVLVTDQGFKDCKEIVWQAMNSVDGSKDMFCTSTFEQTPLLTEDSYKRTQNKNEPVEEQYTTDEALAQHLQEEEDRKMAEELDKRQQPKKEKRNKQSNKVKPINATKSKTEGKGNMQSRKSQLDDSMHKSKKRQMILVLYLEIFFKILI
ncbi:hypothetical protein KAFR_0K00420 [Kazachstania africana CBS 2517]|uniref:MINDY deubiquitinase domain-containing protein n=1 Tax=Kazachstania africana (strain ATCC 22294 / BCRC 22015 / CBS 2517 / CECT 1963 / NBRC 1671 / NRRL Y-8276) TaxID=1071382 RepID=H2B197_KAZAF|nr:hypothetical protein KAFR_0K00420 [Kazachstania africana CBS 2517]CCF60397.1 hypothetical protein KAFR_0K00420 [Kazachstania africana CBS 2517]